MATGAMGTILKYNNAVVGKLTGVGEIAPESEELDVTTLDSAGGYREFIQGYRDSGTVELTGFHEKGNAGQAALRAAYDSGSVGSVEVSFPDGTEVSFRAFVNAARSSPKTARYMTMSARRKKATRRIVASRSTAR